MPCCPIFEIFDEKNLLLKEYQHWKLLLRNRNATLGNCVAITRRHMESFSEITEEEMKEFALVVKDVERALKKSFSCDKMNYLMLMMKDNHTHFHIIPRYATPRQCAGVEWVDSSWPGFEMVKNPDVELPVLLAIKAELQKHI